MLLKEAPQIQEQEISANLQMQAQLTDLGSPEDQAFRSSATDGHRLSEILTYSFELVMGLSIFERGMILLTLRGFTSQPKIAETF